MSELLNQKPSTPLIDTRIPEEFGSLLTGATQPSDGMPALDRFSFFEELGAPTYLPTGCSIVEGLSR